MEIERLEIRLLLADTLFGADVDFGVGGHAAAPTAAQILEFLPDGKLLALGNRQDPTYHEDLLLITTLSRVNADGDDRIHGQPGALLDGMPLLRRRSARPGNVRAAGNHLGRRRLAGVGGLRGAALPA